MHENNLILGAGPAGIAAVYEFHDKGRPFTIIEKNDSVGGLARTLEYKEFRFDIGPHILCSQEYIYDFNESMYSLIETVLGDNLIQYSDEQKKYIETVHTGGKSYLYPIQIKNALFNVGFGKATAMILDYLSAKRSGNQAVTETSLEQIVVSSLGKELADLFILKYTQKIWGIPCSELSSDLAWRVGEFSLIGLMKSIFGKAQNELKNKGNPVCYPNAGIGQICETMKNGILKTPEGALCLSTVPVKIIHDENNILEVFVSTDGKIRLFLLDNLISSIPIVELIDLLEPKAPNEIVDAVHSLKFRSHISLILILNKARALSEHCIYFPDSDVPFARIMEQKNYSEEMIPPDKTSLLIEFFCWEGDALWNLNLDELLELTKPFLQELDLVKKGEIIDSLIHKERYAYPVYDLDYHRCLKIITDYLDTFSNLKFIGRSGSFQYIGQYNAMEAGINAARDVMNSQKYTDLPGLVV